MNDASQPERFDRSNPLPRRFRYLAIGLLLLGIFFRVYHLDYKVYWLDEAYTSLRLSGYTRAAFEQQVFTGTVLDQATLQRYQQPNADKPLADTLRSIAAEEPQMAPLYFVLLKGWMHGFGHSIAAIRSLSVVFSLLAFPALWWLCRELFPSRITAWMAIGLFALSPLHVLYAQEARPYSLWTLTTLLSSAALLWAIRTKAPKSWAFYALTVSLNLYTQLLTVLVIAAHALYVVLIEFRTVQTADPPARPSWLTPTLRSFLLATIAAGLTLIPWLLVLFSNFEQAQERLSSLGDALSLFAVINQWLVNTSRVFIGWDLGVANLIPAIAIVYALLFLKRTTPARIWLFVWTLVLVAFLGLAIPDLVMGGEGSTRIRYLIPCYLGIQLALAHWFSRQAIEGRTRRQGWYRGLVLFVLGVNLAACLISSQSRVWWNKSVPRSSYYQPVAAIVNTAKAPLIMTDRRPIDLLAFSHEVNGNTHFQLVSDLRDVQIADGFEDVFLLNPSEQLRSTLKKQGYKLKSIYEDDNAPKEDEDRLWQITKRPD